MCVVCGEDSKECRCYLRNIQDLLSDGMTRYERRFGVPFKGPIMPFGDQSRLHHYGPKVLPRKCLGYALHAGGIWKGDILVADNEELEQMDASVTYAKIFNAKEVLTPMSGEKFMFPIADGTAKLSGGDKVLRTSTSIWHRPDRGGEHGNPQGESDGSSPPFQDSSR